MLIPLALLAATAAPLCPPRSLTITTDAADGDFNGMQHSGTYLVVTNRGRVACRVEGLPQVTLLDARGRALPAKRNVPVGMHPGPVVVPVTLAPGASARTGLRWVSGPVFDRNQTYTATRARVRIDGGTIAIALRATLNGEAGKPVGFDQPPLAPTPRPQPRRAAAS